MFYGIPVIFAGGGHLFTRWISALNICSPIQLYVILSNTHLCFRAFKCSFGLYIFTWTGSKDYSQNKFLVHTESVNVSFKKYI